MNNQGYDLDKKGTWKCCKS